MPLLTPAPALIISFAVLGLLLYRKLNLGITLAFTALVLAVLSIDLQTIPLVIFATTVDLMTIAAVFATLGIMWLSQLYKETRIINNLSESLSRLINNPKIVLTVLPAIIGFLPVAGGALMSAPLVDAEAARINMKKEKKAYVNLWFRHTIFPVYPLNIILVVTASYAATSVSSIVVRQIPIALVMVITGFIIGFWKTGNNKNMTNGNANNKSSDLHSLLRSFSPIFVSIVVTMTIGGLSPFLQPIGLGQMSRLGIDILIGVFVGLIVMFLIAKPTPSIAFKPLRSLGIYGIALAAYAAFLLRNVLNYAGISGLVQNFVSNYSINTTLLIIIVPAFLGVITASALGGVITSAPLLAGFVTLSPATMSLIFMSAYLGYVVSPTHLCLAFTSEYFGCPMNSLYKYVIPSFIVAFVATLLVYFFL